MDTSFVSPTGKDSKMFVFPKNFFWGSATSSHQVEGNQRNDWTEWERSPARVADLNRRGCIAKYGLENYLSGIACDHYRRYAEDFQLARELGHNATRFSVEWSRIEPSDGVFDERAIAHYRDVVRTIRSLGMEPFVALWHWTHPLWFRDRGGWESSDAPERFRRFVRRIVDALGDTVTYWLTLNEPEIVAASYLNGRFPPQKRNPFAYLRVLRHLIHAHHYAYQEIKAHHPEARAGLAHNFVAFESAKQNPLNWMLKRLADWWVNDYFVNRCIGSLDFIGLNYYFHFRRNLWQNRNANERVSDMGWELYPAGIAPLIRRVKKYGLPVFVTESGCADAQDAHRPWYILETLKFIHQTITEGADVRGYFHWSLLDNFEWDSGFWPRFGLVGVDRITLKRTPRSSAYLLRDIARMNALTVRT
jgi:beta-glucosidase